MVKISQQNIFALVLLLIALALLVIGTYNYLLDGAVIKKVYFSSSAALVEQEESGQEILYDYATEGLRLFVVNNNGELQIYALKQKLGLWVHALPSYNNIQGLLYAGDALYIPHIVTADKTIKLQDDLGNTIYPKKEQQVHAAGQDYRVYIYQIEDYAHKQGNYQLLTLDQNGMAINKKRNEQDIDEISLSLLTRDGHQLQTYTQEDVALFTDERAEVLDTFFNTISNREPMERHSFEGSKLPATQKDISSSTTMGRYLKIEGRDRVYWWTHKITYQLKMNGYYQNTLTRHDQNYFNRSLLDSSPDSSPDSSLFDSNDSELASIFPIVTYYRVESSEELNELFNLFFEE